jgi:hypothetical protein
MPITKLAIDLGPRREAGADDERIRCASTLHKFLGEFLVEHSQPEASDATVALSNRCRQIKPRRCSKSRKRKRRRRWHPPIRRLLMPPSLDVA